MTLALNRMRNIKSFFSATTFLVGILLVSSAFLFAVPRDVFADTQYCDSSGVMTSAQFNQAILDLKVTRGISFAGDSAYLTVTNSTNCSAPISFSAYKMFGTASLSDQQYFSSVSGTMAPNGTTNLTTNIPTCQSQVDMWYGSSAPQTLSGDFNNPLYKFPNVPQYIAGAWTSAPLCVTTPPPPSTCSANHAPTITLLGNNIASPGSTFRITVPGGQTFVDPGFSASDIEDGNLTSKVTVTGSVDTSAVAVYTLNYSVSDSCFATTTISREVLPVFPQVQAPTALIKANGLTGTTTIPYNNAANLTWTSTNASSCIVTPGNFTGLFSNGQTTGALTATTTYTLVCKGAGGTATSTVAVAVLPSGTQCTIPVITSSMAASGTVGQTFSYTVVSSSSPKADLVSTSTLPAGLTFNTSTGILSGTPLVAGTYVVSFAATNICGADYKNLAIIISAGTNQCVPGNNLIVNGDFEYPAIPSGKQWEIFPLNPSSIGWDGYWVSSVDTYGSFTRPSIAQIELDGTTNGLVPFTGSQSAELDSGWITNNGVYQGGIPASVGIFQKVNTVVGHKYKLEYAFGARPGYDSSDNHMGVYVNNVLVREVSGSNVSGSQTSWSTYSETFTATASVTQIEFRDLGTPNTWGSELDSVSLKETCDTIPAPTVWIKANNFLGSTTISYNNAANLTWTSTNASSCIVTPGNFTGLFSNGQTTGALTATTTYTVSCIGLDGSATSSAVTVNVLGQAPQCLLPQITSSLSASATVGTPWSYTITSSSTAATTTLSVSGLPAGLTYASSTNTISGTPTASGTFNITLVVGNQCGTDSKTLVLTVTPANCPLPQITSTLAASGVVGQSFTYTLAAGNSTSYKVASTSLPAGLSFSGNIISGTPTQSGTFSVSIEAVNSCGSDIKTLVITISPSNNPTPKGSVKLCLLLSDNLNTLATTSTGLPSGTFTIKLATSTNFSSTTIFSKTWTSGTFSPNSKIVLNNVSDADCVTVSDLPYGSYYYSQVATSGSVSWGVSKYSDQENQPINNVFDFFAFGANTNADGTLDIGATRDARTVSVLDSYTPGNQCLLPQITSSLSASATVGTPWSYTITSSSTAATTTLSVSGLPAGLTYASSTNTISGTPTASGTFNITLVVGNQCGTDSKTLVLTVSTPGCTSNCGGGGGGADVAVNKTVDKTTANTGDTLTYVITATNNGTDQANNVLVTDLLSSYLTLVSATTTGGSFSTSTGSWTIGYMEHNTSVKLTLTVTVSANATGQTIPNTATITASSSDPNTSNNTSTVTTTINTPNNPPPGCTSNCGGGNGPVCIGNCSSQPSADIVVVKTVDKSTANIGDTLTYSISVTNRGPSNATNLKVTDLLPANLNFVSATGTVGTFATSTGVWTIGSLINGGKETLTLVVTLKNGGAGEVVTNTAAGTSSQNDPNPNDNTSKVDFTIGTPGQCVYLLDFLRKDWNNNPVEVKKLQVFLNSFEGANLTVNGIYDDATIAATDAFQWKYKDEILIPWGHTAPTDFTYILTKKKVNEIYCKRAFPVTVAEQNEIDAYRNFLQGLKNAGVIIPTIITNPTPANSITPAEINVVGQKTESSSSVAIAPVLTTLAGSFATGTASSTFTSRLTANIIDGARGVGNLLFGWFKTSPNTAATTTINSIASTSCQCQCYIPTDNGFRWYDWLLLILAIVFAGLWINGYRANKAIDAVNSEIDVK